MKRNLPYIALILCCICCAPKEKKVEIIDPIDHKAALLDYFSNNFELHLNTKFESSGLDSIQWLKTLYQKNQYNSLWFTDSLGINLDGLALIDQITNANNFGLDTRSYKLNAILALKKDIANSKNKEGKYALGANLELLLSYTYMLFGMQLNSGVLQAIDSFTILPKKKFKLDLPNYLLNAHNEDSVMPKLLALQPQQQQYKYLQKGMLKFLKSSSLSTRNVNVINFREDSLKSIQLAKEALILHQYLTEKNKDSLFARALLRFQEEHGLSKDGLIGKNTADALSLSPYAYYNKIRCSLERWRWKPPLDATSLYVNIPGYKLKVFKEGQLDGEYKTVVGSFKNQTPEIIDTLEYIVAYPYWNVPRKISVEEILIKAQKDSTYLSRNNYEVLNYSRDLIDPNSIDWGQIDQESFNYLMRQKGGATNSLGLVKFIFPNKHAIYLHDTPTKYYFDYETRAYSHGCIRVQRALDLADYLLSSDKNKFTLDSIYKYIKKEKEKPIRLNKKIPIYVYYFPVEADSLGNLTFYNDIYGIDKKLVKDLVVQR